jgi:hypothetical protein
MQLFPGFPLSCKTKSSSNRNETSIWMSLLCHSFAASPETVTALLSWSFLSSLLPSPVCATQSTPSSKTCTHYYKAPIQHVQSSWNSPSCPKKLASLTLNEQSCTSYHSSYRRYKIKLSLTPQLPSFPDYWRYCSFWYLARSHSQSSLQGM